VTADTFPHTTGLATSPALHAGLIAFGIAALLYLVTEELLLEAHHGAGDEHCWWVDSFFFVGFLGSLLLDKAVDATVGPDGGHH
jgi:hypothetical protein